MPKVEPLPFVDENGNLVIPPDLLHSRRQLTDQSAVADGELIVLISGVRLRILINEGKVIAVTRIDVEPDDCPDLVIHSKTSMDFWDNPEDDAVWNDLETT